MSKISPDLLNNTLNIVQLARETALARGKTEQAERLAPVADNLRGLVNTSRQTKTTTAPSGILAQSDFQAMLSALSNGTQNTNQASTVSSTLDRNQVVASMAASGMSDIDIARQMGMAREEVRLIVLSANKGNRATGEVLI